MLIDPSSHLHVYAITRDFGFAPNPFHGFCTLATCKPKIRKSAKVGDWVMGIGGCTLRQVKRKCIFVMKVSEKMSFQEYWEDIRFSLKKPVRNGSRVLMLGDNIYHKSNEGGWIQEDSHHSNADGSPHEGNLARDTQSSDQVLISDWFYYFGSAAIEVDLNSIGFHRVRDRRKILISDAPAAGDMIKGICAAHRANKNYVIADPCQYMRSHQRVDQRKGIIR